MAVFFLKVKKEGGVIPPDEEQMPEIYKTRRRFDTLRLLISGLLVALILAGGTIDNIQNPVLLNTNGVERAVIPVPPSALVLEIQGETPVRNSLTETRTPLLQRTEYYQDVADGRFWTSYCYDCKFPFVTAGIYEGLMANPPYGGKKRWPEDFQSIGFPGADRAALYPDGTLLALQRGNRVLLIEMGLISRKDAIDVMDYARPIGQLLERSGA